MPIAQVMMYQPCRKYTLTKYSNSNTRQAIHRGTGNGTTRSRQRWYACSGEHYIETLLLGHDWLTIDTLCSAEGVEPANGASMGSAGSNARSQDIPLNTFFFIKTVILLLKKRQKSASKLPSLLTSTLAYHSSCLCVLEAAWLSKQAYSKRKIPFCQSYISILLWTCGIFVVLLEIAIKENTRHMNQAAALCTHAQTLSF